MMHSSYPIWPTTRELMHGVTSKPGFSDLKYGSADTPFNAGDANATFPTFVPVGPRR